MFLLVAGGPGLGLWGADATSAMRPDAWTYLSIRGLGAPFTVILLVLQVLIALFRCPLRSASLLTCINHCLHQRKGEVLMEPVECLYSVVCPNVTTLATSTCCAPPESFSCGVCTVKDRTKSYLTRVLSKRRSCGRLQSTCETYKLTGGRPGAPCMVQGCCCYV